MSRILHGDTMDPKFSSSPISPASTLQQQGSTRKVTLDKNTSIVDPWDCDSPPVFGLQKNLNGDPWETCLGKVKEFDESLCGGWKDEVDKLLIFAGLFFSAVTAFVIESYHLLQEDPVERNSWLLEQLLIEIHNANTGIPSTGPVPQPPEFRPDAVSIRINIFWFLSLAVSLGTVTLGILCLQWLREYQRNIPLDPQDAIILRQIRYEGLVAWKVPDILMSLPVLLHLALVLFFIGLLDLLWSLNHSVAIPVSVIVIILLLFVALTSLLPALQLFLTNDKHLKTAQCAYKSPQAWGFHRFIIWLIKLSDPKSRPSSVGFRASRYTRFFHDENWFDYDNNWREIRHKAPSDSTQSDLVNAFSWIDYNLGQTLEMISALYYCLRDFQPLLLAAQALRRISPKADGHLTSQDFKEHLSHKEGAELLSSLYLEVNSVAFPQLDPHRIESVIRVLNTQLMDISHNDHGQPQSPTSTDSTPLNHQRRIIFPFIQWPLHNVRDLDPDIVLQFLLCIDSLVRQELALPEHIKDVVAVLSGVLHRLEEWVEMPSPHPLTSQINQLVSSIIQEVEIHYSEQTKYSTDWSRLQKWKKKNSPEATQKHERSNLATQ